MSLTVIVLTYNEEKHLKRCLQSFQNIADRIIVVDSFSEDKTQEIAEQYGADFFQNPFVNQAVQFQWALDNIKITTDWVMRMDADEYVMPALEREMAEKLPTLHKDTTGIVLKRRVFFMGKWIKHGGYYPVKLLRIWRNGFGSIEQKWMDEHIKVSEGKTIEFEYDIIDDNLNNLTWWIRKHNNYSTREVVDILNKKYNFFEGSEIGKQLNSQNQNEQKRWYKDNLYLRAPKFLRAFLYFIFRYIFLLGFLDGKRGLIWHFLQGFWYRFLTDAKIYQIERLALEKNKTVKEILKEDFNFKL